MNVFYFSGCINLLLSALNNKNNNAGTRHENYADQSSSSIIINQMRSHDFDSPSVVKNRIQLEKKKKKETSEKNRRKEREKKKTTKNKIVRNKQNWCFMTYQPLWII